MKLRIAVGLVVFIAIMAGGYVYTTGNPSVSEQPAAVKVRPAAPTKKPAVDDTTRKAIEGLNLRGSGD